MNVRLASRIFAPAPVSLAAALAEIKRLRRHVAYYRQVLEDCEIVCDPPEKDEARLMLEDA